VRAAAKQASKRRLTDVLCEAVVGPKSQQSQASLSGLRAQAQRVHSLSDVLCSVVCDSMTKFVAKGQCAPTTILT